jgi:hypothetical protein
MTNGKGAAGAAIDGLDAWGTLRGGVGVQARAGAPLNQSGALAGVVEFLANWECTSHLRGDVFNDPALSISDRSSDNSASYLGAQSGQPSAQFG